MHDAFAALHADTLREARALVGQLASGEISPRQFGELFALLLEEGHTEAVVIGRHHAGDTAPLEADDRAFAASVMDGEAEFLAGFVRDLEDDRYLDEAGEFRRRAVEQRAGLYLGRLTGSANEAWGLTLPPETSLLYWHLGGTEHSCAECPSLQSQSPWRTDTIPTYPGMNETPCLANCRCFVRSASGQTGFSVPLGASDGPPA